MYLDRLEKLENEIYYIKKYLKEKGTEVYWKEIPGDHFFKETKWQPIVSSDFDEYAL